MHNRRRTPPAPSLHVHMHALLSLLSLLLLLVFVIGQVFLSVFHWAAWTLVFDLLKGKKALTSRTISGLKRVLPL